LARFRSLQIPDHFWILVACTTLESVPKSFPQSYRLQYYEVNICIWPTNSQLIYIWIIPGPIKYW